MWSIVFMESEDIAIKFVLTDSSSNLEFDGPNSFNISPNILKFLIRENHKHMQKLEDWYYRPLSTPPALTIVNSWSILPFLCPEPYSSLILFWSKYQTSCHFIHKYFCMVLKKIMSFKKHNNDVKYLPKWQ